MRVLVTGATGLIGSAVCARLAEDGDEIVAAVRPGSKPLPTSVDHVVEIDFAKATATDAWAPHLTGIDAVVNCVGVFQDNPRDNTEATHAAGAAVLFRACEQLGVRRVVHFSAMGVDREQPSQFSRTKLEGDRLLMELDLDWVILRPSVVLGRAVYGASAMFRGLAALPVLPRMKNTGALQVVQLDDVADTVSFFLDPAAPARIAVELAGPERLSMDEVVATYRRWLGWAPAHGFDLPDAVAGVAYRLGDFAGRLGWRPPMRSTARREMTRGAVGDPERWTQITGIEPLSLSAALARTPASVQERWFAKLYFMKPIVFVVLPFFWIATGIISLTTGFDEGVEIMLRTGAGKLAGAAVVAGAVADIAVGAAIAWRSSARLGIYGAFVLSIFYAVAGTILLPSLWNEPLGPLMKIPPILVLHLVALGILDER